MKFLERYQNEIFALLRIVTGLLFIPHGIQKIGGFLSGSMPPDNVMMIIAAVIEAVGGLLILIGWQSRITAFIASGEMAAAYFIGHSPAGLLPINNHGELAVLFSFLFLFIASYGAGKWSVDNCRKPA